MKYLFTIIAFLLNITLTFSQGIEWSNPQKIKSKTMYSQVLGETESSIYLLKSRNTEFDSELSIEKYKSNLTFEGLYDLPIGINGIIERVLLLGNKFYVFISAKNNTTGNIDLLVQTIDENIKPVGQAVVLGSIDSKSFADKRHVQVKTSADKSRVALVFMAKNLNNPNSTINVWVYNQEMQQAYAKQINLNVPEKDVFITNFEVSNNGDFYILVDYPTADENKLPRSFNVYNYNPLNAKMLQYAINADSIFVEDLTLSLNNYNQQLQVFGFYGHKPKKTIGIFNLRINILNGLVEHKSFEPIDPDLFYKNLTTKFEAKAGDLNDYYIRKLIARNDGGVLALVEKFYQTRQVYTYYVNNFPQTSSRTVYNYDEIGLISISSKGKIEQVNWVNKKQSSVNDGGYLLSFTASLTNNDIGIYYNVDNGNDNDIMLTTLNTLGKSDTRILVKSVNFSAAIIPSESKQVNAHSLLICALRDKRFSLMRILF